MTAIRQFQPAAQRIAAAAVPTASPASPAALPGLPQAPLATAAGLTGTRQNLSAAAAAVGGGSGNALAMRCALGDHPNELSQKTVDLNAYYDPGEGMVFTGNAQQKKELSPRERTLESIRNTAGPIVTVDAAPLVGGALQELFANLSAAQDNRAAAHGYVSVNEIFFVDMPQENALVSPLHERGVRFVHSLAFISTGILTTALGLNGRELESDDAVVAARALDRFNKGWSAIAGLCAHELAHPLDDIEGNGYARTSGRHVASQAIELKTDIQGALLLRDAGYPVGGLREALQTFVGRDTTNLLDAAASTHPPSDLRVVTLELAETLARYEYGPAVATKAFAFDLATARAMAAELRGIDAYRKRWAFEEPRDLAETLDRLTPGRGQKVDRPANWPVVEQNRLLVRLGEQLADLEARGVTLTDAECERLIATLGSLLHAVADRDLKRLMSSANGSEQFAGAQSFRRRAESSMLLSSPKVRLLIDAEVQKARPQPVSAANAYFENALSVSDSAGNAAWKREQPLWRAELQVASQLGRLLPTTLVADIMGSNVGPMLDALLVRKNGKLNDDQPLQMYSSLPTAVAMLVGARYINEHLGTDPAVLARFGGSGELGTLRLLPLHGSKKLPRATVIKQLLTDPQYAQVAREYRTAMAAVWERRGHIAVGSVFAADSIDWHLIADIAGVSVIDVDDAVRRAVKAAIPSWSPTTRVASPARSVPSWVDEPTAKLISNRLGQCSDAENYATAFTERLRHQFEETGKHNPYTAHVTRAIDVAIAEQTPGWFTQVFMHGHDAIGGVARTPKPHERLVRLVLDRIARHPSATGRLAAVDELFGRDVQSVVTESATLARRVLAIREASGARLGVLGFIDESLAAGGARSSLEAGWQAAGIFAFAATCGPELTHELDALADAPHAVREQALATLCRLMQEAPDALTRASEGMRPVKEAAVRLARGLRMDHASLHATLAKSGPTLATDALLVDLVLPKLSSTDVETLLKKRRIYSDQLRLDLAIELLGERWPKADAPRAVRNLGLARTLETFNAFAPEASSKRDAFLEQLAWRYGLQGRELDAFIEDQKSANWRRGDPLLVRLGSGAATAIAGLDRITRGVFIEALIHHKRGEAFVIPRQAVGALEHGAAKPLNVVDEVLRFGSFTEKARPETRLDNVRATLEKHISDASPTELIPLIAMLLRSGTNALTASADFPRNVLHHLGCTPGDERATVITTFLETLPRHEWAVTLAYFMSQQGDARDFVSGFEVFDAPGIMVGQLAATFGLVDGVEALKHDAKRLSKATIHAELAELPRGTRAALDDRVISFDRVVGSAKLKTVIEVTLDDGRRAALMVRRPNVAAKSKANFDQGRRFVDGLERRGVRLPLKLSRALIDGAELQMSRELDFREEAKRLAEMSATLTNLNRDRELTAMLGGWRFAVPQLIDGVPTDESMLLTEFAKGVSFRAAGKDQLDGATRVMLGPALVKASLMLLFRYGTFEADRHLGNWRFDPVTKTINFIDIGQLTDFSRSGAWQSDDRLVLAKFVAAWSKGNAAGLADGFAAMRKGVEPIDRNALAAALASVMADRSLSPAEQLARLAEVTLEQGIELEHRFLFGGIKGLMVLASEGYVDVDTFASILGDEVRSLMKQKAPAMVTGTLRDLMTRAL